MAMNKELIKNVIVDQAEDTKEKLSTKNIVQRAGLEQCRGFTMHPNILLITGLRRSGKSTFAQLLKSGQIPAVNFDDERLVDFGPKHFNLILESFYDLYDNFNCILLDEPQNVKGWELFVSRLREKVTVIVTGSNANLLSSEMATHLTGRFSDFTLFPMSFKEYLLFKKTGIDTAQTHSTRQRSIIASHFRDYLTSGGIFEYHSLGKEFIRNLFNSIVTKDVNIRYSVKYPKMLEELAVLLVNYFASKISPSRLARVIGVKSANTAREYINYLEKSFLFFAVSKFSFKLKEQMTAFKKIYCMDNGIVSSMIFNISENTGRFLENAVAIELKRRSVHGGFEFFYWDNYNVECDFIIKEREKISAAYQVCSELTVENREREMTGLVEAMKAFGLKKGFILTLSSEDEIKRDGFQINIVPAWKWLVEG